MAKQCPLCGAVALGEDDVFCEADGARLVVADPPTAPTTAAPRGSCQCGQALDDGDGYCTACGYRIVANSPAASAASSLDRTVQVESPTLAGVTDRGQHKVRNEDAFLLATVPTGEVLATVVVVCDGVSSSTDADHAASHAAEAARAALEEALTAGVSDLAEAMTEAIRRAHAAVCAQAPAALDGLDPSGTTIVAAAVARGVVTLGWIGDSRAYWVAPTGAGRLTRDHSWAEEVVAQGLLSAEEAAHSPQAHALTHCIGPLEEVAEGKQVEPALLTFAPPGECWLVLCTDGLWNYAPEPADVARLLAEAGPAADALGRAQHLVDYALARGGHDNVTAALAFLP
jgi:serine/threonine protein phosphatase PrpC